MNTDVISLTPYIFFQGQCEKALNYYKDILDGSVQIVQRYNAPDMQAPAEIHDKVLHAIFQFCGITIFASDSFHQEPIFKSNIALSLSYPDAETGQEVFNKLAEGGTVDIPFAKQFWGSWHGNLTDKYGVRWMVNCE